MTRTQKVIAGPAAHWYALVRFHGRDWLIGAPMIRGGDHAPAHPETSGEWDEWYDITDPAPETNVDALIAELRR